MEQPDISFDNNFKPLPIANLLDGKHHFVIPSFQRGYRWEEKQVIDLLEDIKQFADDESPSSDSYFLQPIVVKELKAKSQEEKNFVCFEVLDGQQRLTTMLLILKRIMKRLGEEEREQYENSLYTISYRNRPQLDFDSPKAADNIDSYYLSEAKQIIDDWFSNQTKSKQNLNNFVSTLLYNQKRQVKIIWYAIDENSRDLVSINIFNRLNKGKIALTSAELIKALFIMDSSIGQDKLRAKKVSMEWNEMERKFQDDNFWYFISNDNSGTQTRIDVLFDFVTCKDDTKDTDYSYREFQKLFDFCRDKKRGLAAEHFASEWAENIDSMEDAWLLARKTFDGLVAWYEDNLYYHYVGFLVAVGFSPLQIYNHLEEAKRLRRKESPTYEWTIEDTKLAFQKIMMSRFMTRDRKYVSKDTIDELEYGSEFISRLLLLFNIECCRRAQNIRFAFDRYKKEVWDVEHVDPQNDATLQEYDDRMRWLDHIKFILGLERTERSKALAAKCQELIDDFKGGVVKLKPYNEFYTTINKYYAVESGENDEDVDLTAKRKDSISNLTLLNSSINREYKDAPFAYKRYCIIEYDKKGEAFIPLCTRNLFLKYYTDSNKEASYLDTLRWNNADKEGYMKAIHEALDPIFDSVVTKEEEELQ